MGAMISRQIGWNLEVYIDDKIVKTTKGRIHAVDMVDVMHLVRKYNMHLNPTKCSLGVQVEKFLWYMLNKRDIKAIPSNFRPSSILEAPQISRKYNNIQVTLSTYSASSRVWETRVSSFSPP